MMKRLGQFIEAVIARIGFRAPTVADPDINASAGGMLVNGKPAPALAVHGFDAGADFTKGMSKHGDAKFAVVHKQATWQFASQADLEAFRENPGKYEPADGIAKR